MKTAEILNSEIIQRSTQTPIKLRRLKSLLAASASAFLVACCTAWGGTLKCNLVADMTAQLLTAPLTTAQRQALHAKNFNQLLASDRALYLHAVAFEVGIMVASGGQTLSSAALAEYLKNASLTGVDVVVTPQLLAHKAIVKQAMQELNVTFDSNLNTTEYQQAMVSGAACSYFLGTTVVPL